jgi:hypothetical protein
MRPGRDILVLLKTGLITEKELETLHQLIQVVETPQHFALTHELFDRFRITSSTEKILKECRHVYLRPFRFLLNKN